MTAEVQAAWCLPQQRRRLIATYVEAHQWVTIAELIDVFQISATTVRRDLAELARRRRIARVRGGASSFV